MKTTNTNILDALTAIDPRIAIGSQKDIVPLMNRKCREVKLAYALQYNLRHLKSAAEIFNGTKDGYMKIYCQMDDDGKYIPGDTPGSIMLIQETSQEYQDKMVELLALEVDIEIRTMELDWFGTVEGGVTPTELYLLDWMLKVEG